ncbi:AAA family ATPase [Campylobacter coli]|nr:AAA family ATPase [Campylobacter coli]
MTIDLKHDIWVEKYRPQKIDDLILPNVYLDKFRKYIEKPSNILLSSVNPGTGKTSTAQAIIKEGNFESLYINASLESGIDTMRSKILQFASTESFDGKPKIVLADEFDYFGQNGQAAARALIEEVAANCRFILTCNYVSNIMPPIVNRFEVFDFDAVHASNKQELVQKAFNLLKEILDNEKVSYTNEDLVNIIKNYYPSIRGMIACLQKCNFNNKLILDIQKDSDFEGLIDLIRSRNFDNLMKVIYGLTNPDAFYEYAFKKLDIQNSNKPQAIIILAKYQYQSTFARDRNLNLAACIMELAPLL